MEASRSGAARLATLARDPDPAVRRAACDALGRVGGAVDALAERLADDAAPVRYAAAFALGAQTGPEAAAALRPQLDAADPNLRLLAARGLGRTGDTADAAGLLELLENDVEPAVRAAAAVAVGLLPETDAPGDAGRDARRLAARLAAEPDAAVQWRIAWALSRRPAELDADVVATLLDAAAAAEPAADGGPDARWIRVMALRALGRTWASASLPATPDATALRAGDVVLDALGDPDPQVRLAALRGLETAFADRALPSAVEPWITLCAAHADAPQVRARACELLARQPGAAPATLAALTAACADRSPTVRAAALRALASLAPDRALPRVLAGVTAAEALDRVAAAAAAASLPHVGSRAVVERALADRDVRVRTAAVGALAGHATAPWFGAMLERAAAERDPALREELGHLLAALDDPRPEIARAAFDDSPGDEFAEARKSLLAAVVGGGGDLDGWLTGRLTDPAPGVRLSAARALEDRGAEVPPYDDIDAGPFPRLGAEVPPDLLATRPVVEVRTTRGRFEITLMPTAAPVHVWNFLQLAAAGRYDGTVFHRVVPDFVVQGGSRRGDGHDNLSWLDGRLRDEVSPLPYDAGTVGMPKTADPDSGGGQFFVTVVPAPYLDGRYTAFGRVTDGLAVVESIEVGDRVERIVAKSP